MINSLVTRKTTETNEYYSTQQTVKVSIINWAIFRCPMIGPEQRQNESSWQVWWVWGQGGHRGRGGLWWLWGLKGLWELWGQWWLRGLRGLWGLSGVCCLLPQCGQSTVGLGVSSSRSIITVFVVLGLGGSSLLSARATDTGPNK